MATREELVVIDGTALLFRAFFGGATGQDADGVEIGAVRAVARRLIDFASGLCYGLDGSMEKVANGVYLLKPVSSRTDRYDDYED